MDYEDKKTLLAYFRCEATKILAYILHMSKDYKNQASMINEEIKKQIVPTM